jgi:hypothetical protein
VKYICIYAKQEVTDESGNDRLDEVDTLEEKE